MSCTSVLKNLQIRKLRFYRLVTLKYIIIINSLLKPIIVLC
jgi:hypothetical protein